jgi:hypothetical protein
MAAFVFFPWSTSYTNLHTLLVSPKSEGERHIGRVYDTLAVHVAIGLGLSLSPFLDLFL